jgi:hypothetical protein
MFRKILAIPQYRIRCQTVKHFSGCWMRITGLETDMAKLIDAFLQLFVENAPKMVLKKLFEITKTSLNWIRIGINGRLCVQRDYLYRPIICFFVI